MKSLAVGLAAVLAASAFVIAAAEKKDIDLKAADGLTLRATYSTSLTGGRPGPAMLLLHQCNMDRHAWDGLTKDLTDAGIHVLTMDFRTFGESGGEKVAYPVLARTIIPEKFPGDVEAAYTFLLSQKGVDKTRVAVGGASCGVTQSADLASRHHEIKTMMLLSGVASDAAKTYIAQTGDLAVFGAASEGDTGAAEGIKAALGASKNPKSTLKMYGGMEHGVPMFAKNAELQPMVVAWLKARLTPGK